MRLLESWLEDGPLVTDGAWGTELQRLGLAHGDCPDAWNMLHPERVEQVAEAYVEAGSRVLLTNTFRANSIALTSYGLADRVREMNTAGARISRRVAGSRALVFASIGPTGRVLAVDDIATHKVRSAFTEQARALADGGADAILVETMSDLDEARLAVEAALLTGLPVVASFTFDSGKAQNRTMMGVTPTQAAREMTAAGVSAVGANCGTGIANFAALCREMHDATNLPLWVKANAGIPEMSSVGIHYQVQPPDFAAHVPGLITAGARFIGGCCGTNPSFIRAIAATMADPSGKGAACD
jgi:5-methyltetrahydrofolate--homocysteine methyltransferase